MSCRGAVVSAVTAAQEHISLSPLDVALQALSSGCCSNWLAQPMGKQAGPFSPIAPKSQKHIGRSPVRGHLETFHSPRSFRTGPLGGHGASVTGWPSASAQS